MSTIEIKKGLDNQAIGLLPLFLFMFLDNYMSYLLSFVIGVSFCFISIFAYLFLSKGRVYQFMLFPSAVTLLLYSLFLCLQLEPMLLIYSPIVTEVMLVIVLIFVSFFKRIVLQKIRNSDSPVYQRTLLRTTLNEFYFVAQIYQNVYTLHLFIIVIYSILPLEVQGVRAEHFLYRQFGLIAGLVVVAYEQIRLSMMRGSLRKEMWLPVLDDKGKVIGCIARSVSRSIPKRYCHPVVRMAVVYQGMLYLVKRSADEFVSPEMLDYPFRRYVLYRHSIEATAHEALGLLEQDKTLLPRQLLRYGFENEKVNHLVSLYVITLQTEEQLALCKGKGGKLWTAKQIEENLNSGVFSEYFEKEFSYLQSTILLAENISNGC